MLQMLHQGPSVLGFISEKRDLINRFFPHKWFRMCYNYFRSCKTSYISWNLCFSNDRHTHISGTLLKVVKKSMTCIAKKKYSRQSNEESRLSLFIQAGNLLCFTTCTSIMGTKGSPALHLNVPLIFIFIFIFSFFFGFWWGGIKSNAYCQSYIRNVASPPSSL